MDPIICNKLDLLNFETPIFGGEIFFYLEITLNMVCDTAQLNCVHTYLVLTKLLLLLQNRTILKNKKN